MSVAVKWSAVWVILNAVEVDREFNCGSFATKNRLERWKVHLKIDKNHLKNNGCLEDQPWIWVPWFEPGPNLSQWSQHFFFVFSTFYHYCWYSQTFLSIIQYFLSVIGHYKGIFADLSPKKIKVKFLAPPSQQSKPTWWPDWLINIDGKFLSPQFDVDNIVHL